MKQSLVKYLFLLMMVMGLLVGVARAKDLSSESVGTAFTYQGRLTNGGRPVTGACDFKFSLWDAASDGVQVGSPIIAQRLYVRGGLFTVTLDFGNSVTWNSSRWLQIQVRCPAGVGSYATLSPRQRLTPAPFALALPGLWIQQNDQPDEKGPNIIGGFTDNRVRDEVSGATISGGGCNCGAHYVSDNFGTIGGGVGNQVGNQNAEVDDAEGGTVSGGGENAASEKYATVGGGHNNFAVDPFTTIGGGEDNTAGKVGSDPLDGIYASVAGGFSNTASGEGSMVGGGYSNVASGLHAFVGAGFSNRADRADTVICGGFGNEVKADFSVIAGGYDNEIQADFATISGGGPSNINDPAHTHNVVLDNFGVIGGGGNNRAGSDDGNKGTAIYATVGGGKGNSAAAAYALVAGGQGNNASDAFATVGGGFRNRASGSRSTIAGGEQNTASGYLATIAGGFNNQAGFRAAVGGGDNNRASGARSVVPGGENNVASGDYSFAAGRRAKADKTGCFMWADATDLDFSCVRDNATMFRSTGGFYIYTYYGTNGARRGAYLAPSGHSWNELSDRNAKENFRQVDKEALLERLARIDISTWNYKDQGADIRHIGPMAQDFNALLPDLGGEGETYINALDADGVALAAIQGLYQRSLRQAERIAVLEEENAMLKAQLDELAARLAALEAAAESQRR